MAWIASPPFAVIRLAIRGRASLPLPSALAFCANPGKTRSMGQDRFLLAATGVLSVLLSVVGSCVFVMVILVVVRRNRPDAVPPLLAAAGAELLLTIASSLWNAFLPAVLSASGGTATYLQAQAVAQLVFASLHFTARVVLIWGVARLARPSNWSA